MENRTTGSGQEQEHKPALPVLDAETVYNFCMAEGTTYLSWTVLDLLPAEQQQKWEQLAQHVSEALTEFVKADGQPVKLGMRR